ncbi:EboA domain-containing protein [Prauserella rugosa]|uniref:Sugar phosphate isomerase n=1 Tax=Prauserella rugosa TaxID=43354 RepID=A0A660C4W2_9PSEU|nr:EboA domain-containing protein [Prauserella rugosa]TWH18376.1 hypothetical protein JD82_00193 [Prauserella rugosa]
MTRLDDLLDTEGRARLGELTGEVTANPARIAVLFPAVARTVGRGPADPDDPDGMVTPRIEDQARVALVCAAAQGWDRDALVAEIGALYRHGDADEKRAVLRALDHLDVGDAALDLVGDALRGNDTRHIAAALGPYAARHLDAHTWRHGVLKCLFTGVPLAAVSGIAERSGIGERRDAELARMVEAFAAERRAAGRDVPADATWLLDQLTSRRPDPDGAPVPDQQRVRP